ncbi:YciI family protein [Sediminitomix flava]|uniref:Uncharacterized protein YciI n=1 Tax=Sediminitomix flava TaxID=379075 RepID=A0A315Z7I8_SEDFL|nr:YciI family protein [Sediminitomix flava]PWJ39375.1 uncharacterized protein YciI [Sediminitomix flava]
MKIFYIITLLAIVFSACQPKKAPIAEAKVEVSTNSYDSALAERLGGDDYGMKTYVMAFLKKGPNRDQDSLAAAELQKAHMLNIERMAEEGKLVMAGPFYENDQELQGLYLFNVETIEEAKALTETDPAIKAGRLKMELMQWYSLAAIQEINSIHKKIMKQSVVKE